MLIKGMIQKSKDKKELERINAMKFKHQSVLDVEHSIGELKQYINMFDERKKSISEVEIQRFMRILKFAKDYHHFPNVL